MPAKPAKQDPAIARFLKSLLSRKFVIALLGAGALLAREQFPETVAVILGYLGVNAAEKYIGSE